MATKKDCGHSATPYPFQDLGIAATSIDAQRRIRVVPVGGPKPGSGGFLSLACAKWRPAGSRAALVGRPTAVEGRRGTDILKLIY